MIAREHIIVRDVTKTYQTASGPVRAVEDVCFEVYEQEFLTILGPSGCGKSTVLGMIGGLVRPDAGTAFNGALTAGELTTLVAKVDAAWPRTYLTDLPLLENRFQFQRHLRDIRR